MRRSDLPDRMTGQHIRPHTPRLHQPEQGSLHREQRRLRPPRLIQQPRLSEQDVTQRPIQQRVELADHLIQRLREHRETVIQLPAHPRPLTPLTGEQECELAPLPALPHHDARARPPLGQGP
ncbi:hypothetical protein Amac_038420 [Acrocarpospora macrocephala]|uniref:Uncharacterized protein n=1 Tax=Acrocarpospora macrocephala TaxID=150177 RepID=A0A5M3WLU7_9ACTN|nr:hypothetical protein Amac_038420 [Acrocarpospora macrocephala]